MAESMESRIFTRAGAYCLKVVDWRLAHMRERESSKNIGMAKRIGHYSCNFGIY